MKHSLIKAKSSQKIKHSSEGLNSKATHHRHRTKLSRAVKRFVHHNDKNNDICKDTTLISSDEKENECPEADVIDIESNEESIKSATDYCIKPKKKFTKRPSVALLVDKFESEVRAVRSKVSKVKLHRLAARSGSFDHEELDSQKVKLTSRSLPPRSKLLATGSCKSCSDREVQEIMGTCSTSSSEFKGSDEDELFVPRGFNTNKSLTLLTRKQAQRRKNYRGPHQIGERGPSKTELETTKIEADEVPLTRSPLISRSEKQKISDRHSYPHRSVDRHSYTHPGGDRHSYPHPGGDRHTHSPDNTDGSSNKLLGGKLRAGDIASLLKNRKSDQNLDQISGAEGTGDRKLCSVEREPLLPRQRSKSEYREPRIMQGAQEKLTLKLSAPSAAFFLNNSTSPLSSSSHPNLSKVLEDVTTQKETVYESRAASPPLERLFETPLQGFQVVKPGNLQPREMSASPPKNALTPKPRTPVSSQLYDKLNGLETLVCEMMTKLDHVDICTRAQGKRSAVQKRYRHRISLKIKITREQRHIRRQLSSIDKKVSAISRRMNLIQRDNTKPDENVSLEEIISLLNLEDYRSVLERESVTRDDFFLLTKSDLTEMGLPLGVRRRILNYTRH